MHNRYILILTLMILFFNTSCKINPVSPTNTAPIASFSIDPTSGTTEMILTFDASTSSDNEDDTSVLQVRWDWDNDGVWDTDYRTIKTIIHQYQETGTFTGRT